MLIFKGKIAFFNKILVLKVDFTKFIYFISFKCDCSSTSLSYPYRKWDSFLYFRIMVKKSPTAMWGEI